MEGVGARLGRSSTRYGPSSTVFNGPVRKWKKKWVSPPSSNHNNNNNNNNVNNNASSNHSSTANNSNGSSHLLLYKWTPISQSQNGNSNSNGDKSSPRNDAASEEPPRRKFKYIPIAVLEEQRNEAEEKDEDEAKPSGKPDINNGLDDKPDINDVPMEDSQPLDETPLARQDLNVSTLDLSLGLKASDGDADSDGKED